MPACCTCAQDGATTILAYPVLTQSSNAALAVITEVSLTTLNNQTMTRAAGRAAEYDIQIWSQFSNCTQVPLQQPTLLKTPVSTFQVSQHSMETDEGAVLVISNLPPSLLFKDPVLLVNGGQRGCLLELPWVPDPSLVAQPAPQIHEGCQIAHPTCRVDTQQNTQQSSGTTCNCRAAQPMIQLDMRPLEHGSNSFQCCYQLHHQATICSPRLEGVCLSAHSP